MQRCLWFIVTLVWCGSIFTSPAEPTDRWADYRVPTSGPKQAPGVELAQTLSTITGVAISPLLGVGAVGAWKYFATAPELRARLPWFAQPWFWAPALVLIAFCFAKDLLGPATPTVLKKPLDWLELFENKLSALVVAGAFVPLVASIFHSSANGDTSLLSGTGLAMIDLAPLLNALAIPLAIVVFALVWLVAHTVNVLVAISPFATVDIALKAARLFLLATVTGAAFVNPYLGGVWSLGIVITSYFLAGWAFRLMVFGEVFFGDLLTFHHRRFVPDASASWAFTAREIDQVPVRSYGKLSRDEQGRFRFRYRPWLFLPGRTLNLTPGEYAVGRGLLHPEILMLQGDTSTSLFSLPPRYRTHEGSVVNVLGLAGVREVGLLAFWQWLKTLFGLAARPQSPALAPA
jgi:hypothetical protein